MDKFIVYALLVSCLVACAPKVPYHYSKQNDESHYTVGGVEGCSQARQMLRYCRATSSESGAEASELRDTTCLREKRTYHACIKGVKDTYLFINPFFHYGE